ncbi:MAG: MoaD/ThiS family protein [Clostridiales bacterium]|jgi:molybdopterin converting factor small subunit|nr:MoaD/ThiS family protein [Clostridiales bacterium]
MALTVFIPAALRPFTDGLAEASVEAKTAGQAVAALAEAHPDIKKHLYDENGALRPFVNLYAGEVNVKNLDGGLDAPIDDGGQITLVPAIAGGCL